VFIVDRDIILRVPTLLLIKNPGLSRTPMRNCKDLFEAHECFKNIKKKPFPLLPPLPLEVGSFKSI